MVGKVLSVICGQLRKDTIPSRAFFRKKNLLQKREICDIMVKHMYDASQIPIIVLFSARRLPFLQRGGILLPPGKIAADGSAEAILRDRALLEANRMELPFCLQGWHR